MEEHREAFEVTFHCLAETDKMTRQKHPGFSSPVSCLNTAVEGLDGAGVN